MERSAVSDKIICPHHGRSRRARRHLGSLGDLQHSRFIAVDLQAAAPTTAQLADGSLNGVNSWGNLGYGGPCPPSGTHRYFFKLYALDTMPDLPSGANKQKLLSVMQDHVLAQGELMGTFSK